MVNIYAIINAIDGFICEWFVVTVYEIIQVKLNLTTVDFPSSNQKYD